MADNEKRIVELQEVQSFGTGDYLALDNIENTTTKKILAKKLGITYTIELTEDGFIFSGDNGYSQEIIIPKDEQMSYEDYQDLSEEEKMNNANRFIPDYPNSEATPEIWARVGTDPLNTEQKTISKAINELDARDKNSISDEYDPVAGTYAVGDTCLESNLLRVCNTAIDTPHAFDETEWDTKTLGEYCAEIKSNLTDLEDYWYDGTSTAAAGSISVPAKATYVCFMACNGYQMRDFKMIPIAYFKYSSRATTSGSLPQINFYAGARSYLTDVKIENGVLSWAGCLVDGNFVNQFYIAFK